MRVTVGKKTLWVQLRVASNSGNVWAFLTGAQCLFLILLHFVRHCIRPSYFVMLIGRRILSRYSFEIGGNKSFFFFAMIKQLWPSEVARFVTWSSWFATCIYDKSFLCSLLYFSKEYVPWARGRGKTGNRLEWRRITWSLVRSDLVMIRATMNCRLPPK